MNINDIACGYIVTHESKTVTITPFVQPNLILGRYNGYDKGDGHFNLTTLKDVSRVRRRQWNERDND